MGLLSWGGFVSKIADRFIDGKQESLRNKIYKIKREMDDIVKKNATDKSVNRYRKLANKLQKLERKALNT